MVLLVTLPERLGHIVGKFRDVLSKSQFENFQNVMFGLIVSHCKEHDVKNISRPYLRRSVRGELIDSLFFHRGVG